MKAHLNLHFAIDEGREAEAAAAMQRQLPPDQWKVLAQLAAEIVARWETVAAGQRVVVVPAAEERAEVARALRLRVAEG